MELEWLILADSAEVLNNKLYLLGGGWDVLRVRGEFPHERRCAIAVSVCVPWADTNQPHEVEVTVLDQDGNPIGARFTAQFEVGRPPGLPAGSDQRFQFALTTNLKLTAAGTYVVEARIAGSDAKKIHFHVVGDQLVASRS